MVKGWLLAALLGLAACKGAESGRLDPVGEGFMDDVHAQCVRKGGDFMPADNGSFVCMSVPSDAGKSCERASQCQSACLSRSRTCAPVLPLLGCNDVLTDSGLAVTQCVD